MSKFIVLVTSTAVSEQAQKLLRDAGADIIFMANPVDEQALLSEVSNRKIAAVLLRGPAPFTPSVLAAAAIIRTSR